MKLKQSVCLITKMLSFLNFKFQINDSDGKFVLCIETHMRYKLDSLYIYHERRTPPPFFCCCKDGHNTGQNIGTKTWQKVSV